MRYQIPTSYLFLKRNTELRKAHIHSIIAKEASPAPSAQNSTGCTVTYFCFMNIYMRIHLNWKFDSQGRKMRKTKAE